MRSARILTDRFTPVQGGRLHANGDVHAFCEDIHTPAGAFEFHADARKLRHETGEHLADLEKRIGEGQVRRTALRALTAFASTASWAALASTSIATQWR